MAKVLMSTVYRRIVDRQYDRLVERKTAKHEAIAYDFATFAADLRSGDLLTTTSSIKSKWDCMTADGVLVVPEQGRAYSKGVLIIRNLELKAHTSIPENGERVCACVCINNTNQAEGMQ